MGNRTGEYIYQYNPIFFSFARKIITKETEKCFMVKNERIKKSNINEADFTGIYSFIDIKFFKDQIKKDIDTKKNEIERLQNMLNKVMELENDN